MSELTAADVIREIRSALQSEPKQEEPVLQDALELVALAPEWPEGVVTMMAMATDSRAQHGELSQEVLNGLVDRGWIRRVRAAPPATGTIYKTSWVQRRKALQVAQTHARGSSESVLSRAVAASVEFTSARTEASSPYSQVVEHWCTLLQPASGLPPTDIDVAERLRQGVELALEAARSLNLDGSIEAALWLDAAEPLAVGVGGAIRVAWARARRDLELFHRNASELKRLRHYVQRDHLDNAFEDLLADDEHWALHYIGLGGAGKTMFLGHLQATLAERYGLATARVDFDHLNPNYPLLMPGLLLLSFSEELKLKAPESAVARFGSLVAVVNKVHGELESAQRSGNYSPLGFDAPGFASCLQIFIDALGAIYDSGRRPVLILDTCEELARLRSAGKPPRNVLETFRILEAVAEGLKRHGSQPLRIVFSGRRPLARRGFDWSWIGEALDERSYLRICPIREFTRDEALKVLSTYERDEGAERRAVRPELYEGILKASEAPPQNEFAQLQWAGRTPTATPGSERRYGPYDVALYAGWAADGGIATAVELIQAGRHHYVRERIISRARDDLSRSLPHLSVIGRFDEELVREIAGAGDGFADLWAEIRQQEWIEPDRATADVSGAGGLTFWSVSPRLRSRLESYYACEATETWVHAQRDVADVLERITVDRDWQQLTPDYVVVCADLLRDEEVRATAWWHRVEANILKAGAWGWAEQLTEALLDDSGPIGPSPREDLAHPLNAPVRALRANVQMRTFAFDDALGPTWETVLDTVKWYPDQPGRAILAYRARAGLVAALRFQSAAFNHDHITSVLSDALERIPQLDSVLSGIDSESEHARQVIQTETALIDNCVELCEMISRSGSPPQLIEAIARRIDVLGRRIDDAQWLDLYRERIKSSGQWLPSSLEQFSGHDVPTPTALRKPAFDWIAPESLKARRLLEYGRLLEYFGVSGYEDDFSELALRSVSLPGTLDEDRMLSQALRLRSALDQSFEQLVALFHASLRLAGLHEQCQAHLTVPPLYVTAMQMAVDGGRVAEVLDTLQRARQLESAPPVVDWLDALSQYINRKYLLIAAPRPTTIELKTLDYLDSHSFGRRPASVFMGMTARCLAKTRDGHLKEDDYQKLSVRAKEICDQQGFDLPGSMAELEHVPNGWGPWFARYLVVRASHGPAPDRKLQAELNRYLAGVYYPAPLPADVAFLDSETRKPPVAYQDWSLSIWLLGIAVIAAGAVAVDTLIYWSARLSQSALTPWKSFPIIIALTVVALLILAVLFPRLRFGTIKLSITLNADGTLNIVTRLLIAGLTFALRAATAVPAAIRAEQPYVEASVAIAGQERRNRLTAATRRLVTGFRVPLILDFPEPLPSVAPLCWEAMLAMAGGVASSFAHACYVFRRVAGQAHKMEHPFPGTMTVLSVSALRDLTSWAGGVRNVKYVEVRSARRLTQSPDRAVGVLVLQAQAIGDQQVVKFSVDPDSKLIFGASDIARLFPNLRLCVILGFDLSEVTTRTPSDRLSAAAARAGGADLFMSGIPAVICVPMLPLRGDLTEEVLGVVARVIVRTQSNACWPLQQAVRKMQEVIFMKCGMAESDATELAYDVCYYAADQVNMRINASATAFDARSRVQA